MTPGPLGDWAEVEILEPSAVFLDGGTDVDVVANCGLGAVKEHVAHTVGDDTGCLVVPRNATPIRILNR